MATAATNIWVSTTADGANPYYRFFTDAAGTNELIDLTLEPSKNYTFKRLNNESTHPFYISDTGYAEPSSSRIQIAGNGASNSGIKGTESFTVSFKPSSNGFSELTNLFFYSTEDPHMQGSLQLEGSNSDALSTSYNNSTTASKLDKAWNIPKLIGSIEPIEILSNRSIIFPKNWELENWKNGAKQWSYQPNDGFGVSTIDSNASDSEQILVLKRGGPNPNEIKFRITALNQQGEEQWSSDPFDAGAALSREHITSQGNSIYVTRSNYQDINNWENPVSTVIQFKNDGSKQSSITLPGYTTIRETEPFQDGILVTGNKEVPFLYEEGDTNSIPLVAYIDGNNNIAWETEIIPTSWGAWDPEENYLDSAIINAITTSGDRIFISGNREILPKGADARWEYNQTFAVEINTQGDIIWSTDFGNERYWVNNINTSNGKLFISGGIDSQQEDWNQEDDFFFTTLTLDGTIRSSHESNEAGFERIYAQDMHSNMLAVAGRDGNEALLNVYTISAPSIRGNSLYSIVDGPSRDAAKEQAKKLGGTLTAINNESENNYIVDQLGTKIEPVSYRSDPTQAPVDYKLAWIGLEQNNQDNSWEWSNSEPLTYTNWNGAGPSGGEPLGEISLTKLIYTPAIGEREAGDWHNAPNNEQYLNYIAGGIAEIPFIRRDNSAYVIVEGNTWAEAQANAVALGGNLATINNEAENEWITKLIHQRDTTTAYWIGLNDQDEDETYTWINGETSSYRAWDANGEDGTPEPSGNTYGAMFGKPEGLNYSFKWIEAGNWYSVSENIAAPLQAVGGSLAGIAEIPLAPNQTPSGQPELQGALEVGHTLKIDPSKINDNDNSEYWSPTYHYSWEVSNNQGKSWVPLESRDANDGNATLTLTSNELGLQLRGRASYLDGMGSHESLTTTASNMGRFRLSADQSNHAGEPLIGSTLKIDPVVNISDSNALEYSWQYLSRTHSKALNAFGLAREEVALNFNISGDAITGTVMIEDLFNQADYPSHLYSNKINNIFDTAHGVLFNPSSIGGSLNQVLASENNAPYYLPTYKSIAAARGLPAGSGAAMHMGLGGFELYLSEAGEPIELLSFDSEGNLTSSEELTGAALLNAERELKINLDDSVDFYGATINGKEFNKDLITPSSAQRVNAYTSNIGLILSGQQLTDRLTIGSNAIPTPDDIILLSNNNDGYSLASDQTIRNARWSFDSSDTKIYELYLEGPSNSFEKIVFNSQGALQSSESLTNAALLHAELELQLDLDGDGTTAGMISGTARLNKNSQTPPHAFTGALNAYDFSNESLGNGIVLSSEQLSQGEEIGKRTISHSQQLITLSDHNNNYERPGDKEVAAARTLFSNDFDPAAPAEKRVDGYELYLRSTSDDNISKATFNADGGLTSTTPLAGAALIHAELELKLDLDNNGVIATKVANELLNKNNQPAPYPIGETLNVYTSSIDNGLILSTNWLNPDDNIGALGTSTTEQLIHLSANNQGFTLPDQATIKLARTQFANGSGAPADTSVEGYELLVATTPNSIDRFSFDANGIFTGSELLAGPELINTEHELQFDLNGDGITSISVGEQLLNKTIPPHTYTGALNVYNSESGIILTSSNLANTANSWSNPADQLVVVSKDGEGFKPPKFSSIKAARALYADRTTTPSPTTPAIGYELFLQDGQGAINKYSLNADGEVLIEEEWKSINMADAVDGDHTYTLTDADLGRQIRGIITSTNGNGNQLIETTNALDRVSFQLALNGYANIGEYIEIDANSIPAAAEILDGGFEQQWPEGTHVLQLKDFAWENSGGKFVVSYQGKELNQVIENGMAGGTWNPQQIGHAIVKLNLASEEIEIHLGNPESNTSPSGVFSYLNYHQTDNESSLSKTKHKITRSSRALIIRPESLSKPLPLSFKDDPDILVNSPGFVPHTISGSDPRQIEVWDRNSDLRAFVEVFNPNGDPLLVRSEPIKIGGILTDTGNSSGGKYPPAIYTPNNEPQGRLKLIGTAKKGETIHLDDSSISDEDAITTPLTYSWQVFNSGTQRWDQLGTNDAKDQDLTLTSALIGAQMRGHATYTDGNGLEEVVLSEPFIVQPGPEIQEISTTRQSIPYLPGSSVSIPLQYHTSTSNSSLQGLTINLHYDSSVLTPAGNTNNNYGVQDLVFGNTSSTATKAIVFDVAQEADHDNSDADLKTDSKLVLSWFSSDSDFRGSELPKDLASLLFNTTAGATVDPVTGSQVNVTSSQSDRPENTSFSAAPIHLIPTPFSLDVDGDGNVSLYTDGIMIIRRLIGLENCTTGFSEGFFNQANRHSAERVDALLDQAYDAGKFDFDQNNNTSLYTDGILLIRHLISPSLINSSADLVASTSPFKDDLDGLNQAFEALKPSIP